MTEGPFSYLTILLPAVRRSTGAGQITNHPDQAGLAPLLDESLVRTARPVRGKIQQNSRQRRLPVKRNRLRSRDAFPVFIREL